MRLHLLTTLLATLAVAGLTALAGCSEDPEPPVINQNQDDPDAGPVDDADAGEDVDPGPDHNYCESCSDDGDCIDGLCLDLLEDEQACGKGCDPDADDSGCPDNAYCARLGGDETTDGDEASVDGQCVPERATCDDPCQGVTCPAGEYCAPSSGECESHPRICETGCRFDAECGDPDEHQCIPTGAPDGETMCTTTCDPDATGEDEDLECPSDYICAEFDEGGPDGGVCYPIDQTCTDRCRDVDCAGDENCDPVTGECVEVTAGVCEPECELDAECEGQDDRCLDLGIGDGPHCWQNCDDGSCPDGYECSSLLGLTDSLCLPETQQCEPCYDADCYPDGVCDPTTGDCIPHPEDCTEVGCDDGEICEPSSQRCVAVDRTCSGDSWATDCDNVVTRCSSQTSGTEGVCATICDDDADCQGDRSCESTTYGDLCLQPDFGGPDACGVTARADQDVGQPCQDGEGDCSGTTHCVETGNVPGFCTDNCSDDADCPADATCGIGPDGNSVCLPVQCHCASAPNLDDDLRDGLQEALEDLELTACDLYTTDSRLQEAGDWTDRAMLDDDLRALVASPTGGFGRLQHHVDDLDDAVDSAELLVAATSLLDVDVQAPVAGTTDSDLADAIVDLDDAAGGDLEVGDIDDDLDDLPADVEALAADLVAAIDDAYRARDDAFSDAGIDESTLQTLFDETHRLVLPSADDQQPLDVDDADVADALQDFPLDELTSIAADLTATVEDAVDDADIDPADVDDDFVVHVDTAAGAVVIGDTDDNTYDATGGYDPDDNGDIDVSTALVLETGGDNDYRLPVGANQSVDNGVSLLVDLDGADTYSYPGADNQDGQLLDADDAGRIDDADAGNDGPFSLSETARQGAGRLGIGMVFDYGDGNDSYETLRIGQGAGVLGVGALFDLGGEASSFDAEALAQGAAVGGLGLIHSAGSGDSYRLWHAGQGFGAGGGAGLVVDDGADEFVAVDGSDDDLFLYYGTSAGPSANKSLAQGAATGTDEIAAGTGVLRNLGADTDYTAGSNAQGFGRHLGAGLLADDASGGTFQGASAHQGFGTEAGAGVVVTDGGDEDFNAASNPGTFGQGTGERLGWGFVVATGDDVDVTSGTPGGGVGWSGGFGFALFDGGPNAHSNIGGGLGMSQYQAGDDDPLADGWTAGIFVQTGDDDDTYDHPSASDIGIENDAVWRQDDEDVDHAVGVGVDQ